MKSRRIVNTDLTVLRIPYGGCAMQCSRDDKPLGAGHKRCAEGPIHTSSVQGINFLLPSDMYAFRKSESVFGEILRASPGLCQDLLTHSKSGEAFVPCWRAWGDSVRVDLRREHIAGSVVGSLKRLQTDHPAIWKYVNSATLSR